MTTTIDVLANPAWAALTGRQAALAEVCGRAACFRAEVSGLHALAAPGERRAWADLAVLAGPEALVTVPGGPDIAFRGWELVRRVPAIQLIGIGPAAVAGNAAVTLTPADLPEVWDLIRRSGGGPARPRMLELGRHVGIRRRGRLVAVAGERLRPPGWTEIGTLHIDPAAADQALEAQVVAAVAEGIRLRGDRPFLHVPAGGDVVGRYRTLGFARSRTINFHRYRRVAPSPAARPWAAA